MGCPARCDMPHTARAGRPGPARSPACARPAERWRARLIATASTPTPSGRSPGLNVTTEEAGAVIEHSLIAARDHRFPTPVFTPIERGRRPVPARAGGRA